MYPDEEICFRNGKQSTTKLVNPSHDVNLYTHRQGKFHIDTIGGHYGISYLTNRAPFSYRSKLLKDWKLKRQYLSQVTGDMMREDWVIVKVNKDKFAICPTFIYNWCVIHYRNMKGYTRTPKTIKGRTFINKYIIALEYVYNNNDEYVLYDEDFIKLEGYYFEMKDYAYLDGKYVVQSKKRLY